MVPKAALVCRDEFWRWQRKRAKTYVLSTGCSSQMTTLCNIVLSLTCFDSACLWSWRSRWGVILIMNRVLQQIHLWSNYQNRIIVYFDPIVCIAERLIGIEREIHEQTHQTRKSAAHWLRVGGQRNARQIKQFYWHVQSTISEYLPIMKISSLRSSLTIR